MPVAHCTNWIWASQLMTEKDHCAQPDRTKKGTMFHTLVPSDVCVSHFSGSYISLGVKSTRELEKATFLAVTPEDTAVGDKHRFIFFPLRESVQKKALFLRKMWVRVHLRQTCSTILWIAPRSVTSAIASCIQEPMFSFFIFSHVVFKSKLQRE